MKRLNYKLRDLMFKLWKHAFVIKKLLNVFFILLDDCSRKTWFVRVIEVTTGCVKFEIVSYRFSETFEKMFKKYIKEKTKIITDGHASFFFCSTIYLGNLWNFYS